MIDLKQKCPHDIAPLALSFLRNAFATACQCFREASGMGFACSGCDMLGHCRSRMVILLVGSLLSFNPPLCLCSCSF